MRNKLQLMIRLLCMAAFLWITPGGIGAQGVEWDVWNGSAIATGFAGGSGIQNDPYQISSGAQLAYLAQQVNLGNDNGGTDYSGVFFKLTKNIDLNNEEWTPIGKSFETFKGNFDGNALTIKNLKVNNSSLPDYDQYIGLFGCIENATIEKLTVIISDAGIKGYCVGGITGAARGTTTTIKNCCVLGGPMEASVSSGGEPAAGGIVGAVPSAIVEGNSNLSISFCCANVSNITASLVANTGSAHTGGIVGYFEYRNTLSVTNCLSLTTNMTADTYDSTFPRGYGGIIGEDGGSPTLNNNYSNPLCVFTDKTVTDEQETTTTSSPTTGSVNNADGAALTPDNFNASGALAGWEAQGWTLTDGYLPKISHSAPDILVNLSIRGLGTVEKPYLISTAKDLKDIARLINSGTSGFNNNESYQLENDIDLEGMEWTPIGILAHRFKGTFDGKGHCISGLKVNISSEERIYAGLFGMVSGGTIQNLGVSLHRDGIRVQTTNFSFCGGIAGATEGNAGTIRNCYVVGTGSVESIGDAQSTVGGIVGESRRDVSHCYATVNVRANNNAGGILGASPHGTLSYSFATGNVETTDRNEAGGISSGGGISHCLALNKEIKGAVDKTYRIGSSLLSNNYASSKIKVNGNPIKQTDASHKDGSDEIDAENYLTVLKDNGGSEWGTAWIVGNDGSLPKLKVVIDNGGTLSYTDWPSSSPQPTLKASDYLPAGKIANPDNSDGKNAPIKIANKDELVYFAKKVNEKKDIIAGSITITNTDGFKDYKFTLSDNIDLSSDLRTPIGNNTNPFCGSFDGGHHTVTLSIKADANLSQAGLFGTIDAGAKVEKLAVHITTDGITSTASAAPSNAGAIAAINKGTIDQCYVTGEGFILCTDGTNNYAGGIAGTNEGAISNSYNLIPVKVNDATDAYFGGIAGYNTGTIEYCFAAGEVGIAENTVISSLSVGDEKAGGIAGFNDHLNAGVVRNCLAVNAMIPTDAHRVIGTGGDADDVNNFSFRAMPHPITKSGDVYNPLEGTPLTKDNLNSNAGGCFNGWDVAAWNLDNISTHLPKIQSFADTQHNKEIAPYLLYTVTIGAVTNGTLSITRPDPKGGSTPIVVSTGDQVPYDSQLTIAATPDAKYELDQLQVNGATFTNGGTHVVKDDVTISATFKKIPDPTPTPDPDPKPDPAPVYYTVTLPAVEGVVTDPVAGEYQVKAWDTFRFYLALDTAYDKSVPVITTSYSETLTPRPDGAYRVKYVHSDVQIFIDGIVKNPSPVANESIEASRPKIWRTNNYLHMQSPTGEQAYIYTPAGKLQASCKLLPGEVKTIWLPSGIYFIRIGKERCKVTVDN